MASMEGLSDERSVRSLKQEDLMPREQGNLQLSFRSGLTEDPDHPSL